MYVCIYICVYICMYVCMYVDDSAVWGTAYDFFGGGKAGEEACQAIGALAMVGQIDTTITNFLIPLQVS
jgi:hypothetical protein